MGNGNDRVAELFLQLAEEARRQRDLRVLEVADFMEAHEPPELHFCCGINCPGLEYRASDRSHPLTCSVEEF